jgi:3-isopropylmalate/(R)-2-methylmalate dehydratase small subunit
LPIVLDEAVVAELAGQVVNDPQQNRLSIDLAECIVVSPNGQSHPFDIEFVYQQMLMEGLDAIDITMKSIAAINAYSRIDRENRSWAYLD